MFGIVSVIVFLYGYGFAGFMVTIWHGWLLHMSCSWLFQVLAEEELQIHASGSHKGKRHEMRRKVASAAALHYLQFN